MTTIAGQARATPRPRRRAQDLWTGACAAAAAAGAAVAGAHPTGSPIADRVWAAGFAIAVVVAAARAHRSSWMVLAGITVLFSSGLGLVIGVLTAVAAGVGAVGRRRSAPLGAAIGAVAVQLVLRFPPWWFHGATAFVAAIATTPLLISGWRACAPRSRRRINRSVLGAAVVLSLMTLLFLLAVLLARNDIDGGVSASRDALRLARQGQTVDGERQLSGAITKLSRANRLLNSLTALPARAVPVVGQHARALGRLSTDGDELAEAADHTLTSVDYDQLKYRSGQFDVDRIARAQRPLLEAAQAAARADDDLRALDVSWIVPQLRDRIESYRNEITTARHDTELAAQAAKVMPGMLGAHGERRYFIAFVTPAELRGSGGFIGSYGELVAEGGRIRLSRSGPISDLLLAAPDGTRKLTGLADYQARYGAFVPADHFQDLTFSPNFPDDADAIEQLYPQSGGRRVDGVLQVDPFGLAALLRFTGPVQVAGLPEPLTADNAVRILLEDQYRIFGHDTEQNDALSGAARATFQALTTGSLPSPRDLSHDLSPMVRQGRFKFHSTHRDEEALATRVGLAWAMPRPRGQDMLAVTTQNNGNSKIDVYLHRSITYDVAVDPKTGTVAATATVRLENRAPAVGLPAPVIGNTKGLPEGTSRLWLSLYSPLSLVRAHIGALTVPMDAKQEAGYSVYGQFLNIGPGQSLTVTFKLRGHTTVPHRYSLDLFPQPTVNPDQITVRVRGGGLATAGPGWTAKGRDVVGHFVDAERHALTVGFSP